MMPNDGDIVELLGAGRYAGVGAAHARRVSCG